MKTSEAGFSIVETILVLVALVVIGGGGYVVYQRQSSDKQTATTQEELVADGTAQSAEDIFNQDIEDELSLDSTYSEADESDAASANSAAENLGGAYDESRL